MLADAAVASGQRAATLIATAAEAERAAPLLVAG
jgi:hypothetical protein